MSDYEWADKIGKPAYESIREMIAALDCNYERMEILRGERDDFSDGKNHPDDAEELEIDFHEGKVRFKYDFSDGKNWELFHPDDAEELAELESEAGDCSDQEDAIERIQEDPLSVMVRSGWGYPGDRLEPEEYELLLTTGGPAVRITGVLDEHGSPSTARLQVQDWGKPWTDFMDNDPNFFDNLLVYARQFYYG